MHHHESAFMRRGALMAWLTSEGLSEYEVRTLITVGVIATLRVPGRERGRALFSREQVRQAVLRPLEDRDKRNLG